MLVDLADALGVGLVVELLEALVAALLLGPKLVLAAMSLVLGGAS